ncbi:hypothetical protein AHAS_Ahas01G0134000 [Arachis hypogaea]
MHDHGLPTSTIMGLMVGKAGGYANVGFTKKDLDNHFQRTRRAKLIGGDSNATINYLLGKADVDPMGIARYSATDEEVMLNKSPSVVVTDADEAMKAAIQEIFPDATHRLCGWHIQKNRKSWASTYLRDKFCAGFRTRSRCEAINNFIKRFICIHQILLELVQNLEHTLRDYRNNELVSQFKTMYGEPVLTTGQEALELSAANFYTREILGEVKKKIQRVIVLDVINEENISTIVVLKVKECDRRQHIYNVLYDCNTDYMECECSRWSSEGIPCNHMFCAMKRVGLQKLPDSLLLKRWSKDAKKYLDESSVGGTTQDREREFLMRYGALSVAATWMVFLGAQDDPSFHDTMKEWSRQKEHPRGKSRRVNGSALNSTGHVKNKCPVRNDGDNLGDKISRGAQVSFGTEEELPKDPLASLETLAMPNTEVNAPVQQEFGLGDSGLINVHETPIPAYGSHQWLLQVYRNVILKNEYQSSNLCEALYTPCEDMTDRIQVLRLPSMAKFNAGLQNCNHSFEHECVELSKTNYEQCMMKMLGKSKSQFIKDYNQI